MVEEIAAEVDELVLGIGSAGDSTPPGTRSRPESAS